jgi:hypothetical protein
MASLMASASGSTIWPSAWARHSSRARLSRDAVVRALAAAVWSCSASMASPFGITSRRRARTISGKAPLLPQIGACVGFDFRGVSGLRHHLIFPGSAGTPARLTRRVSCFWGLVSPIRRDSPDVGFRLFAIRVNEAEALSPISASKRKMRDG